MARYKIERRGGLAGLKANATIDEEALAPEDRAVLEELVAGRRPLAPDRGADLFTYVVTRESASGNKTREVPESQMPEAVTREVRAEL